MEWVEAVLDSKRDKKNKNQDANQNDVENNINPAKMASKKSAKPDIWNKLNFACCLGVRDFVMGLAIGTYGAAFWRQIRDDKKKDPPAA